MKNHTSTTHPMVVTGVVIIASIMLFSVYSSVMIVITWAVAAPESEIVGAVVLEPTAADYFGVGRVILVAVLSSSLSWATWKAVSSEVR